MAVCVNDPKIGQIVYDYGSPQNPGKIIAVKAPEKGSSFKVVVVRWLKKKKGKHNNKPVITVLRG